MAAGPTVNLLFAFLLFAVAAAIYGSPVAVEEARIAGVREGGPAASAGLRTGDTVVAIDDASVAGWEDLAGRVRESGGTILALTGPDGASLWTLTAYPDRIEAVAGEAVITAACPSHGYHQGEQQGSGLSCHVRHVVSISESWPFLLDSSGAGPWVDVSHRTRHLLAGPGKDQRRCTLSRTLPSRSSGARVPVSQASVGATSTVAAERESVPGSRPGAQSRIGTSRS